MSNNVNHRRLELFQNILNSSNFFKLDFGMNTLENYEIFFLTYIYSIAGYSAIDISSTPEMAAKIKDCIKKAQIKAAELSIRIPFEPFLIISINETFFTSHHDLDIKSLLSEYLENGADSIELHLENYEVEAILSNLKDINSVFSSNIFSLNVSRKKSSNANIVDLIKKSRDIFKDRLIVEVDGLDESKSDESFNSTLQAISTADIINKELISKDRKFKRLKMLLSGGTNSMTSDLASQCGVKYNGITLTPRIKLDTSIKFLNFNDIENNLIRRYVEMAKVIVKDNILENNMKNSN